MESALKIFEMPLFPHIYAIPMSMLVGMVVGYILRGKIDAEPPKKRERPKID